MDLYPWVVLVHVVAAFAFAIAHGVSAFVSFRLRVEREPGRVRALLELSGSALGMMYGSVLVLLAAGIAAGIAHGWFGRLWIWAALATFVVVAVLMYGLASRYYARVREAVGIRSISTPRSAPDPTPVSAAELAALLDSRRPDLVATVGFAGLLIIVWLMVLKPF
ncbi:MAG TPA: hypothetical protein VIV06_12785 [Candidatus Limnocylindrales bacterium]